MSHGYFRKLFVQSAATFNGGATITGSVTGSSRVTGSKGLAEGVEKKSHSTGQAALNVFGLSVLSATAASTYTLAAPPAAGTIKHITMTTASVNFVVKTTAAFAGTTRTKLTVVASKAPLASQGGRYGATLVGATGGKWALVCYTPTSTSFTIT